VHDPTRAARWTRRKVRSDRRVRRERAGAAARAARKKTSRLHRPHSRDGPEDDGDRVFSIDERVTGWRLHAHARGMAARHVSDDRTTHPERPPDRATPRRSRRESEKPQGRMPTDRGPWKKRGRKAGINAGAGHVRRPAAFGANARRDLRVLKGTCETSREAPGRSGMADRAGRDTDPSVVPGSADCFGAERAVADT
jgi:hypothetical protein